MIPFHPSNYFQDTAFAVTLGDYLIEEELAEWLGYKSDKILHSKYEQVDTNDVAKQQTHLSEEQQDDLARLFKSYTKLFLGKLGKYRHRKVHLDLVEGAKPVALRPYPVAKAHLKVFKDELDWAWLSLRTWSSISYRSLGMALPFFSDSQKGRPHSLH